MYIERFPFLRIFKMKTLILLLLLTTFSALAGNVSLAPASATGGAVYKRTANALVIDFPAYSRKLNNTHPTINLRLPSDCSEYDGVDVDLCLSGGLSSSLSINFRDNTGKQCYDVRPISDRIRTTLRFRFNPARKMDKKQMKFLRIYLSRPALPAQFTIYSIKLFSALDEEKAKLVSAAATFGLSEQLKKISSREEFRKFTDFLRKKQLDKFIARSTLATHIPDTGAGFLSSLSRPLPFSGLLDESPVLKGELSLAGNETENIHIVTVSKKAVKEISASITAPSSAVSASIHPVGAVKTSSSHTPGAYTGWHFDPILEYSSKVTSLKPYQLQLWVVRIKTQSPLPAPLQTEVRFNIDGKKFSLPLKIQTYNFTLPERKTLKTATSVYGSKLLGKNKLHFERWLLDNFHINNFSIYSDHGSYGIPVLPAVADYSDAVKRGLNFIPLLYLKLPRQAHHTAQKIAPGKSKQLWEKMSAASQARYPEEWKKKYIEILKKRIPELKKANLWQYAACYAFDEATPSEWPAIIDLVKALKKHFPDLRIVSTITDHSYGFQSGLHGIIDEWIPPVNQYNFERAEKARTLGRKVWYYTTGLTVDGTPLAAIRTQLGERAIANKVDGWLVWTVSRWYNNPLPVSGTNPLTPWNPESYPGDNGGGSYFCMGQDGTFLSTLRAEAMRDGIEDYEYYTVMMQLARRRAADDPLRKAAEQLFKSFDRSGNIAPVKLLKNRVHAAHLIERMKK